MDQDDTLSSHACDRCGRVLDIGYRAHVPGTWVTWARCEWCQLGIKNQITFDGPDFHPYPEQVQFDAVETP